MGILAGVYRGGGVVVQHDDAGRVTLAGELTATLDVVPDYLVITTVEGRIVFASAETQPFSFQEVEQLADLARRPPPDGAVATVTVQPGGPRLRYAVRPVTGAGPELGAVVAGATTAGATLELEQLLGTFALTLPFGLLIAYVVGSWIADRALGPIDAIITEVREITDGRSLHRRGRGRGRGLPGGIDRRGGRHGRGGGLLLAASEADDRSQNDTGNGPNDHITHDNSFDCME